MRNRGREMDPIERRPWSEVRDEAFVGLRAQLDRILRSSPWYQQRFEHAGVSIDELRTPEDLARVPFMDKHDERRSQHTAPPYGGHLCVERDQVARVHASSGTTGSPTFFALTERDLRTWDRVTGRAFRTAGMGPGDVFGILANLEMFVGGVPAMTAAESIGATVVPVGAHAGTVRTLEILREVGVSMIGSTPSFAVHLAEIVEATLGAPATTLGLRRLMVGGEPGGQIAAVRKSISEVWGCPVRDIMGIGEFAPALWAESDDEDGLHFCGQDAVYLELIDSDTGESLALEDGAQGELVYTAIEREATPLVRFRSHDQVEVRMSEVESGRTAPRVVPLGRTDDMLIVRGVNVFPSALRDVVMSFVPAVTGHLRIVLDAPGPAVPAPVDVEVETEASLDGSERDALKAAIEARVRDRLSFRTNIVFLEPGTLERTSLKTNYIRIRGDEESQ